MLLPLTLLLVLLLAPHAPPTVEFHVQTEDAYATQCRAGICVTLQVTRSRPSDGVGSTLLFFAAYDERGAPIAIPGFPSGFTDIPSEHFVMSPQGTQATLNYSGVTVTWEANGVGKKKPERGARSRVSDREQELSAAVKGTVGPIVFNPAAPRRPGEFTSAYLTLRTTVSRSRAK